MPVEVSTNAQDFSYSGLLFHFVTPASLYALEPHTGPTKGGTTIAVYGSNFSPRSRQLNYLSCRFNTTVVSAIWVSSTLVHCVSPPSISGPVSVDVTNSPPSRSSDGPLVFEFADISFASLSPNAGPLTGGTLLTLTGASFVASYTRGVQCIFVDISETEAYITSATTLVCPTPQVASPLSALIRVRLDGSEIDVPFRFTFSMPLPVYSITPQSGPQVGGTSILVAGQRFSSHPMIFCRFGLMHSPAHVLRCA